MRSEIWMKQGWLRSCAVSSRRSAAAFSASAADSRPSTFNLRLSTIDPRLSTIDRFRPFVHRQIRQPVSILVLLAPHVLERHAVERGGQRARLLIQRLEAGVLHA